MSTFTDVVKSTDGFQVLQVSGNAFDQTQGTVVAEINGKHVQNNSAAITAGTTQTLAGATPIVTPVVAVTVGTASDGVFLPVAVAGVEYKIINTSATLAGKLYAAGGSTINGTAGATGVALTAAILTIVVCGVAGAYVTK